ERAQRTWTQRFSWASVDGRQMRFHHLTGLRRYLDILAKHEWHTSPKSERESSCSSLMLRAGIGGQVGAKSMAEIQRKWSAKLDAAFSSGSWHDRERQVPLSAEQDALLRELISQIPALDPNNLEATLHPPLRKMLLAELGHRDPSLAIRVASHLWAR